MASMIMMGTSDTIELLQKAESAIGIVLTDKDHSPWGADELLDRKRNYGGQSLGLRRYYQESRK